MPLRLPQPFRHRKLLLARLLSVVGKRAHLFELFLGDFVPMVGKVSVGLTNMIFFANIMPENTTMAFLSSSLCVIWEKAGRGVAPAFIGERPAEATDAV